MTVTPSYDEVVSFAFAVTTSLARAEKAGRVAPRFMEMGPLMWAAFRNELTQTDLLELAVRDAAAVMPQPFALDQLWPGLSGDELRAIPPEQVEEWIGQGKELAEQSTDAYLRTQAQSLGISLPADGSLARLPIPDGHHKILELPGSAGWLAYQMAARQGTAIYYWENFTIACSTWQEQLLAGLIAFELGAPARRELPIVHDPSLSHVLRGDVAFDWIVGLRQENARRAEALRSFLRPEGRVVLI